MTSVKFFHRDLPITAEPESVMLEDGKYKFWEVVCPLPNRVAAITMRTKFENGAWRPLQERVDEFVRKDSANGVGYDMIWAKYVRPASKKRIEEWMQAHKWLYK